MNNLPGAGGRVDEAEERIQSYLDELLLTLRGRPREARRLLAEVEAHLRQAVDAGVAAGLDRQRAAEEALERFGPPSAVARGLSSLSAYRTLLGQLIEAALLLVSLLFLAVGVAAVPAAVVGLAGSPGLVTGDRPGQVPSPGRCQQLIHMLAGPGCAQALTTDHLQDVIRSHLGVGVVGFVVLVAWWMVHVHRQTRPAVLPTGFTLTVCGPLLGSAGMFLLAIGVYDAALGAGSNSGLIGAGDLLATGGTVMAAALLCWVALVRQATRPARNLVPR